jgi:hypothetical protein
VLWTSWRKSRPELAQLVDPVFLQIFHWDRAPKLSNAVQEMESAFTSRNIREICHLKSMPAQSINGRR